MINNNFIGTINVGGPIQHSRLECLKILLKSINVKDFIINEVSLNEFKADEILPLDVSFDISYLLSIIDFKLSTFEENIKNYIN